MRNSNIVTLDSKGRILLPGHLRKTMEAHAGTEILLIPDHEGGHVKLLPLVKHRTAEFRFLLPDYLGSMANVASTLADFNATILMSESRSLVRGKLLEWNVIADTAGCADLNRLTEALARLPQITQLDVTRHGQKGLRQATKSL